jgi:hypothetical protein
MISQSEDMDTIIPHHAQPSGSPLVTPSSLSHNQKHRPSVTKHQTVVEQPADYDILCGKDKSYIKHVGNQAFHATIESWAGTYQQAKTKQEKMEITRQIVAHMQNKFHARFLKRIMTEGPQYVWIEISDQDARDKIIHAFKNRRSNGRNGSTASATSSSSTSMSSGARHTKRCSEDKRSPQNNKTKNNNFAADKEDSVDSLFHRQQAILGKDAPADSVFSASHVTSDSFVHTKSTPYQRTDNDSKLATLGSENSTRDN